MILREMLQLLEAKKNHLGEDEQTTFAGWKRACKKVNADVWFEGDKDIAQAMVGPNPYEHGKTKSIGEWDGEKGCVYSHAKATKPMTEAKNGPKSRGEKFEPGWYVVDEDDVPFHGPFENERKANMECTNLGGKKRGYAVDYIESLKEGEEEDLAAWKEAVKKKYPDEKIKFRGNADGDVEAVVDGVDRLFGIFDVEKSKGEVLGEGVIELDEKRMQWHDSDAPDANGKFKELGVQALGDWLIKTRNGDMSRISGSLTQQVVMNRKRDPAYAKKMESVREYVKKKLKKD